MKILIVEDHQPTARSLKWYLDSRYDVELVTSCQAAQQKLEAQTFDLLLTDLSLPDGEGTALCGETVGGTHMPSIVVSGNHDIPSKVRALDAGADDYVTKPFTPLELIARVKAVLRRYARNTFASEASEISEIRVG